MRNVNTHQNVIISTFPKKYEIFRIIRAIFHILFRAWDWPKTLTQKSADNPGKNYL